MSNAVNAPAPPRLPSDEETANLSPDPRVTPEVVAMARWVGMDPLRYVDLRDAHNINEMQAILRVVGPQ